MMNQDMISIIIPVYQVEKYLNQCLDSVVGQSYRDIEVILVDDGSTDRSGLICDEFAQKDHRISVIHKENGGLVSARKAGLRIAKGSLIAYVDSDDWIEIDAIERMFVMMNEYRADAVVSAHVEEYEQYNVVRKNYIKAGVYEEDSLVSDVFSKMLYVDDICQWGLSPACWGKLLKREFVEKYQYEVDDRIWDGEDHAFIYSVILESNKIVITDDVLYHHRIRDESVATGYDPRAFERFSYLFNHLQIQFQKNKYWNILKKQFSYQMRWFLLKHCFTELGIDPFERLPVIESYIFPFQHIEKGDRIVLYGAGNVGKVFHRQIITTGYCEEVAWVDKKYDSLSKLNIVKDPGIIVGLEYDRIVVAVLLKEIYCSIKKDLKEYNVPDEKIIWTDSRICNDIN